ncbi:123_t:CDS:2 [Ambispora gerdemannii]|uniref:123_t:CDS:1 n=1 Tax=Ambispora gerdemannii TaxID=144530 RepID=A0A9N8VDL1_9GLOM|nr:123_t:CDS:2 [Ambispora gerdemannii]
MTSFKDLLSSYNIIPTHTALADAFYCYIQTLGTASYQRYVQKCAKDQYVDNLIQYQSERRMQEVDDNYENDEDNNNGNEENASPSCVEFNEDEIKRRLKKISQSSNMSKTARLIINNIDRIKLKPNDLISDGILEINYIKQNNRPLYEIIKKNGCLKDFALPQLDDSVGLTYKEVEFVRNNILYGSSAIPEEKFENHIFYNSLITFLSQLKGVWRSQAYKEESETINEKSYSHQIVKPFMDFINHNVENIETRYDGHRSVTTQNRNAGNDGPIRYPDVFSYKENKLYSFIYKYLFGEISNGPFAKDDIKHIIDDKIRLGKFSKDNLNSLKFFIESFDDLKELEGYLYSFSNTMLHFYRKKMDVYYMDYAIEPFFRLCLIKSVDLPLTMSTNEPETVDEVIRTLNILISINKSVKKNTRTIDLINNIIVGKTRGDRTPERRNVSLTNSTHHYFLDIDDCEVL